MFYTDVYKSKNPNTTTLYHTVVRGDEMGLKKAAT
jgi:hypothetical protein